MRDTIYFYKLGLETELEYLKHEKLKGEFWIGHINGLQNALDRLESDMALTKRLGDY